MGSEYQYDDHHKKGEYLSQTAAGQQGIQVAGSDIFKHSQNDAGDNRAADGIDAPQQHNGESNFSNHKDFQSTVFGNMGR